MRPKNTAEKPETRLSETTWFPHDTDCTTDPKLNALIDDFGAEGYGIYWHIIELLHAEPTGFLPAKKYVYKSIAKTVKAKADTVERLVNACLTDYDLFIKGSGEADEFTSKRVLKNKTRRLEIVEKKRESGRKGGLAKAGKSQADAKQSSTISQPSAKHSSSKTYQSRVEYIDIYTLINTINTVLTCIDGSASVETLKGGFSSAYPRKLSESDQEFISLYFGQLEFYQAVEILEELKMDLESQGAESGIFADVKEYLKG
jgi:hypothetical protein